LPRSIVGAYIGGGKCSMTVILRNNNSTLSVDQFEVYDNVADLSLGVFTLKGGESKSIDVAQAADGKGSVKLRPSEAGSDGWTQIDDIELGDVISA
jgi:hypothetical protein